MLFFFFSESVQINVSVTEDVEGVLGNDFVPLSCSYEHDNDSTVFSIQWEKKRISGEFVIIAYFSPPGKSQTNATFADTPEGKQLSPRAELYNPTEKNRTATLRLRYVECQDEAEYRCTVIFLTTTGTQSRSDTTSMTVKGWLYRELSEPYHACYNSTDFVISLLKHTYQQCCFVYH